MKCKKRKEERGTRQNIAAWVLHKGGLKERNVEHGEIPALLRDVTRRGIGHVH